LETGAPLLDEVLVDELVLDEVLVDELVPLDEEVPVLDEVLVEPPEPGWTPPPHPAAPVMKTPMTMETSEETRMWAPEAPKRTASTRAFSRAAWMGSERAVVPFRTCRHLPE
jgi:hypothetical protein